MWDQLFQFKAIFRFFPPPPLAAVFWGQIFDLSGSIWVLSRTSEFLFEYREHSAGIKTVPARDRIFKGKWRSRGLNKLKANVTKKVPRSPEPHHIRTTSDRFFFRCGSYVTAQTAKS